MPASNKSATCWPAGSRPWRSRPSTVLGKRSSSGAAAAVQPFQDLLDAHQIGHQRLATTHAFHCALVEPILEEFATVAQQVSYAPPQLPYFSGMLGTRVTHEVAQASYWQQHLRQPVRFYPALQSLMADPPTAVLEVGAGSTACGLIRTAFRRADVCAAQRTLR